MCRKVCLNCRCGKAEHNVVEEEDPGFFFVGKLFDRYSVRHGRYRAESILDGSDLELLVKLDAGKRHLEVRV